MIATRSLHLLRSRPLSHTTHLKPLLSSSPPTHLRLNPHNINGRRSFHWQSTINTAIEGTQSLILTLHTTTHLPWFLTIPLAAIAVGVVFRLPAQIYTRVIVRRRSSLSVLLQAWNARISHDVARLSAGKNVSIESQAKQVEKRQAAVTKRIYKKLGLQKWRLYTGFAGLPFWLLGIDGFRRLCGGPRGLIGSLIAGPDSPSPSTSISTSTAPTDPLSSQTQTHISEIPTDAITSVSAGTESTITTTIANTIDPALTFEGCLWFTNLTVPDPLHILPILLSISLVYNILPKSDSFTDHMRVAFGRAPLNSPDPTAPAATLIRRQSRGKASLSVSLVGLSCLIGPLTLDLPAALHLYWLSSSLFNGGMTKALKLLMPFGQEGAGTGKLLKQCTGTESPIIKPVLRKPSV
ncbi:hypothetical protein F4808DRAFT_245761 [Astrocystis sublimbata]|nr:hypothetical protein F4808DRAFT_245761 [Astrocystis sublimbata]